MTRATTTKNKTKKPLQTTLGKAPVCISDGEIDLSHVKKPIETSIFGLQEVLALFKTATEEVQSYVSYECDIMYECRICRTIFRSLANFVLHKREYCRELYKIKEGAFCNEGLGDTTFYFVSDSEEVTDDNKEQNSNDEKVPNFSSNDGRKDKEDSGIKNKNKRSLCTILPCLIDKQESTLFTEECLKDTSNKTELSNSEVKNNIALQKIEDSKSGVYQSTFLSNHQEFDFMKTEVMEIHNVLENNEAILGIDGKIVKPEGEKNSVLKNNLICTKCNETFSTKKTLKCHIKYRHNNSKQVYKCTDCSDTFANTWGVFRHLYKAHRKTSAQVKKLRGVICNNLVYKNDSLELKNSETSKNKVVDTQEKLDLENKQWLNDLEGDNDLQICGGCGRKFDRKAALISHSHFCTKRIALCNSIKGNSTKRLQEEKAREAKINGGKSALEGIRRRKPLVAHKLIRYDYYKEDKTVEVKQPEFSIITNVQEAVEFKEEKISEAMSSEQNINIMEDDQVSVNVEPYKINEQPALKEVEAEEKISVELTIDKTVSENVKDIKTLDEDVDSTSTNKRKSTDFDNSTIIPKRKYKEWHALGFKSINYIDNEKMTCLPCEKVFKCKKSLLKHMAGHFNWNRYECKECPYKSYQKLQCQQHIENIHEIKDKDTIDDYIKRLTRKKTIELSTDFVDYTKKFDNSKLETKICEDENLNKPDVNDVVNKEKTTVPTDNFALVEVQIQDPVLMKKMIFEVIFGSKLNSCNSTSTVTDKEEPSNVDIPQIKEVLNTSGVELKEHSNIDMLQMEKLLREKESLNTDVCTEGPLNTDFVDTEEYSIAQSDKHSYNNGVWTEESLKSDFTQVEESSNTNIVHTEEFEVKVDENKNQPSITEPMKDSRPVRNRVAIVKEDFLYDMSKLLKSKPSKPKTSINFQKRKP